VLSTEAEKSAANGTRVLVVEDDPASRRALILLLKLRGIPTLQAANLSEAMLQLKTRPTIVLLDLMLPDGNGYSLLQHIREHDLPMRVAVTSGASNWRSMLSDESVRPDAIFPKPLHVDQLLEWLER
jgi:DNA-binding response OmpR family regulator